MTDPTIPADHDKLRSLVRDAYGSVAEAPAAGGCCSPEAGLVALGKQDPRAIASGLGYTQSEIDAVPEGANLGLGCGNPGAFASLRPGEVVVDLGAGAGFDALLAAQAVGPEGRVIGVDMTPEMLEKARTNAVKAGLAGRVEFREGIIEALPIVDGSADVVISNCVINLSPDKPRVFREAFRVLKPGGRLAVSDIVLSAPLPAAVAEIAAAWVGCIAGAMLESDYLAAIEAAGFEGVRTTRTSYAAAFEGHRDDPIVRQVTEALGADTIAKAASSVWSVRVEARKPAARTS